jgi:hypothetical protein
MTTITFIEASGRKVESNPQLFLAGPRSKIVPKSEVKLDGDPTYMASNMVTGPKTMPVNLEFD